MSCHRYDFCFIITCVNIVMERVMNLESYYVKMEECISVKELEAIHQELFGKAGYFSLAMKDLKDLSAEERKNRGAYLNEQKNKLLEIFAERSQKIKDEVLEKEIAKDKLDLSLPLQALQRGGLHPISYAIEQIIAVFHSMDFKVATANEIEEDWYNFTALNVAPHHPARQDHDTFYLNSLDSEQKRMLLRTHTSNTQIRTMLKDKDNLLLGKPIRIISPGRTYRSDSDATHSPMFHQVEGLYVDEKSKISVPLLKTLLANFCSAFFAIKDIPMRFRPSYFPFTSPSYEVDMKCSRSANQLIIGRGEDWLEILGSGIVHPNVLENCGIDSTKYSGLAFGMGIERLLMLKYGFKDLREMYKGDIRWLEYYNVNMIKSPSTFAGLD